MRLQCGTGPMQCPFPSVATRNPDEVKYTVEMFIKYQNPLTAFHVLRMALQQRAALEPACSWMCSRTGVGGAGAKRRR